LVQEGFLLTGKGGIRQVFGGSGGAYGDGEIVIAGSQLGESLANCLVQSFGEVGFHDPLTDLGTGTGQSVNVIHVQRVQGSVDPVVETTLLEKLAIGISSGGKAARYGNTRAGQIADHFAKRGVLAADTLDIPNTQLLKGHYVL